MITKGIIEEFFAKNSKNEINNIFISEKDLVFCFAFFLNQKFPNAIIKFEFPFQIKYNYSFIDPIYKMGYLDLYVKLNEKIYGFEFKYKTKELSVKNSILSFNLKNQGAQDLLRFEFRKDIHRLEYLKYITIDDNPKIDIGFAVILSNDSTLYNNITKETADKELRFSDNTSIKGGSFKWHPKDDKGAWLKEYKYTMDLKLRNEGYSVKWNTYIEIENNLNKKNCIFKYCVVEV